MKVMIAGDMHGNVFAMEQAVYQAEDYGCKLLIQVGDFGFWEHVPEGVAFLNACEIFAEDSGVQIVFADGNHENHPMLREKYPMNEFGHRYVRPMVRHVERGHYLMIGERKIQFFGGAWSINNPTDKIWERYDGFIGTETTEGVNWWPEEEPTQEDVDRALSCIEAYGKPDIMIAHEAPWSLGDSVLPGNPIVREHFPQSKSSRDNIETVWLAGEADLLVHGHYHHYYVRDTPVGRVVGLGKETGYRSLICLDLNDLSFWAI